MSGDDAHDSNRLLVAALDYVARGWPVFPLHDVTTGRCSCGRDCGKSAGKHPRTPRGFLNATLDPERVRAWWLASPTANVGIATGYGLLVLDGDPRNGSPEDPPDTPEGPIVRTGGGGWHVYATGESPCRNLGGGVELKGAGGYVVAPPSLHASGEHYTWLVHPDERHPEPLPNISTVASTQGAMSAIGLPDHEIERIEAAVAVLDPDPYPEWIEVGMCLHAAGDDRLFGVWDSWSQRSAKHRPGEPARKWRSFRRNARNDLGLGTLFLRAQAAGFVEPARNGHAQPHPEPVIHARESFDPPAVRDAAQFPLHGLYAGSLAWLADYVESVAESLQVPVDMPAMVALPYGAVAAAQKYRLHVSGDWYEPASIWVLCAMESGERKSAVIKEMARPMFAWQRAQRPAANEAIARWKADRKIAERESQQAVLKTDHQAAREAELVLASLGEQPAEPQVIRTDATGEGLTKDLARNHERLLIASPEADLIDILVGRYSDSPALGAFLAGHAGDHLSSSRASSPQPDLYDPTLSVALAPQIEPLSLLLTNDRARQRGLTARFLYAVPSSRVGWRNVAPPGVDQGLRDRWGRAVTYLLDLAIPPDGAAAVALSHGARDRLLGVCREIETDLRERAIEGSRTAVMSPWYCKIAGQIGRVALVLHALQLVDDPTLDDRIDDPTVEQALALLPYLEGQLLRALGQTEDQDSGVARRILAWLERVGRTDAVTRREIYQAIKGGHGSPVKRVADVEPALAMLVEGGRLEPVETSRARGGRTPSPRYRLVK